MTGSGVVPTREEILKWAIRRLRDAGLPNPTREAWRLLAPSDGSVPRFLSQPRERVSRCGWSEIRRDICRRARREPLAYIREKAEFYSREFHIDGRVLIPRPETEVLVDTVLGIAHDLPAGPLADVGTGSGVIAITLAHELPDRRAYAIDIDPGALEVARQNVRCHALEDRVLVRSTVDASMIPAEIAPALVVSNPPYIPTKEIDKLEPEVSLWEPRVALDGGPDGLAIIRRLIGDSARVLPPGGYIAFEIGMGQAPIVEGELFRAGFVDVCVVEDLAAVARIVRAKRPGRCPDED
ncbi:MAG: peptide chain release factor N(5)-glutamine methyltransferase [Clostridia bacterium]